ncbi:MAG: hypothetical protein R3272_15450 [Candidatus Promineifilaceae bacterium]|nr:hypothetical protein [Candidatus Promineifilaceae bacterium]
MLVTAGGGTRALAWLQGVAGASRTLLEGLVPYAAAAFDDFLGQTPGQYVAADTGRMLAGRALTRARWLQPPGPALGLACTATLATDRPKRGEHRAHIAGWRAAKALCASVYLEKGARSRAEEEEVVSRLLMNVLLSLYDLEPTLSLPLRGGDQLEKEEILFEPPARRLQRGQSACFAILSDGRLWREPGAPAPLLLSGAFNPLHEGHLALARAAEEYTGKSLAFELAARNVAKPALEVETILERMAQFAGRWPVIASRAPTFDEKALLYPGVTFVVGYDTATRVIQPRFYEGSVEKMRSALDTIRARGCSFLVAGRVTDAGRYRTVETLTPPEGFADLFQPLPGFRYDRSSTEIRRTGQRGSR